MSTPSSVEVKLSSQERVQILQLANSPSQEFRLVQRAQIILEAASGANNCEIARRVRVDRKTVQKWRRRYVQHREKEPEKTVHEHLADEDRRGRPPTFDAFFWVDVMVIATSEPSQFNRPITEWTQRELADEVVQQKLAPSIHPTTVGRFLAEHELQPHRVKGWMNRKKDADFEARATEVKDCLVQATAENPQQANDEITVSFDEKTGMQAKEHVAPVQAMEPGQPKRIEVEYKRHGTLVLFALMLVHRGTIMGTTCANRPNEVTAAVMEAFFAQLFHLGYKRIHVILDQLNTHWSVALLCVVAKLSGIPVPSPKEIETGAQRRAWLSNPSLAIVFHFTPKHASWLNPIEIWFGILVRKLLRHNSFISTEDLGKKVQEFIEYYNDKLAHPYHFKKWKKLTEKKEKIA